MCRPKGGARRGAGRKPKLSFDQKLWLKRRYEELMSERAKERAIYRALIQKENYEDNDGSDGEDIRSALKSIWTHLKALPLSERKSEDAKLHQKYAAELIGKQRFIKLGSGRGPLLESGKEETAEDIRQQVADEANKKWKRDDISERDVRAACEMSFSAVEIMKNWLFETPKY